MRVKSRDPSFWIGETYVKFNRYKCVSHAATLVSVLCVVLPDVLLTNGYCFVFVGVWKRLLSTIALLPNGGGLYPGVTQASGSDISDIHLVRTFISTTRIIVRTILWTVVRSWPRPRMSAKMYDGHFRQKYLRLLLHDLIGSSKFFIGTCSLISKHLEICLIHFSISSLVW